MQENKRKKQRWKKRCEKENEHLHLDAAAVPLAVVVNERAPAYRNRQ